MAKRHPHKEYPDQTPVAAPVKFRGRPGQVDQVRAYIDNWSRTNAEDAHVETIEEANNFDINDPDDEDFFPPDFTPYELLELPPDTEEVEHGLAENNETDDAGAPPTQKDEAHEQSAPHVDSPGNIQRSQPNNQSSS